MKIIHIKSSLLAVFSIVLLGACEKETVTEFTDSAIIESYLTPDNYLTVSVSRQIPFSSNVTYSGDDINNLPISINYNGTSRTLTSLGNGQYTDNTRRMAAGDQYSISFPFNSKQVSASTTIPSKPMGLVRSDSVIFVERQLGNTQGPPQGSVSAPIQLTWDNPDASYYFVLLENMETTLVPISPQSGTKPPRGFKKAPTNSTSDQLRGGDFEYYGKYKVTLYHVLPDYATLYEDNNSSSQNLTNPSSNVVNGYGIFTGMNSTITYIYIKQP